MLRTFIKRTLLTGFVLTTGLVALSLYANHAEEDAVHNGRPIGIELQLSNSNSFDHVADKVRSKN